LTKNGFQRTVLQDTDFIRFFTSNKQRKLSDSFSVQTGRLIFLIRFNNSDSFSLPNRNQQRSFIEILSAKPFKFDRNSEQTSLTELKLLCAIKNFICDFETQLFHREIGLKHWRR